MPSSSLQIEHRTAGMVTNCKKYCLKSSAYLQSRVPQFDSGFRLQLFQTDPSNQTQAKLQAQKVCNRYIHPPSDSPKNETKTN
jgi:hypothetical protein